MAPSETAASGLHIYFHDTSTADYWYWMYMALASHLSLLICPSFDYDSFCDATSIVKEPPASPCHSDNKPQKDNVTEVLRKAEFTTKKKVKNKKRIPLHRQATPPAPVQCGNSFNGLDVTDDDYDEFDCSASWGYDKAGTQETTRSEIQRGASPPYDEFDTHLLEHYCVTACQSDDEFIVDWTDLNNTVGHRAHSASKHDCDDGTASSSCRPVATQSSTTRSNRGPHHHNNHDNNTSRVQKVANDYVQLMAIARDSSSRMKRYTFRRSTSEFDKLMTAVHGKDKLVAIKSENDKRFEDLMKAVGPTRRST